MQDKILKGPTSNNMAKMGVGEYFWLAAETDGDRICQIDAYTQKEESFDTVRKRALRVALQLKQIGVQEKDSVMLICLNNLDNVIPALAAMFLGAYACSCNHPLDTFDIKYFVTQVGPKVLFVIDSDIKLIEEAISDLKNKPIICVIGESQNYPQMYEMEKMKSKEEVYFKPVKVDVKDTAFIVFSSGTTSLPKGVRISHLSVFSILSYVNDDQLALNDNPVIQLYTLNWISGIFLFANCLLSRRPRIVGSNLSAEKYLQLIETYKVQLGFMNLKFVDDILNLDKKVLKKYDVSSIETISLGGMVMDQLSILQLRNLFPNARVVQNYSATEIGTVPLHWFGTNKNAYENKISSVGVPSFNTEIKVVDIETREPLGPNQEGELLFRSPYRMIGYINYDDSKLYDEEGFYKSGDYGYYDEDNFIYILDRVKYLFKCQGCKVAPTVIENVLRKHPDVKDAAVLGIPYSGDNCYPAACIVLTETSKATVKDIYNFVKNNLSDIYLLRGGIKLLNELPRTSSGKISKIKLQDLFNSPE